MNNPIQAFLSALCQGENTELRARERGTPTAAPARIPGDLPRHQVSLTATASIGFAGFPEEIRIRDINEKGLYFYTKLDMPVGSTFDIVVILPAHVDANGEERRVHYEAKVVRIERRGEANYGVGASIRRCETFPLPSTEPNATRNEVRAASGSVEPTEKVREEIQPVPQAASPNQQAITPAEENTAPGERTAPPAVIERYGSADRAVTSKNQNQVIVERLATAAMRAGISLEELILLINSGVKPSELVDVIEARLMSRVQ